MRCLKISIVSFLVSMVPFLMPAQTEQGVFRIGGDLSFNHHGSGDLKENIMETRFQPGLFLGNNILVGLSVGVDKDWVHNRDELLDIKTEIKIGPEVTYYIKFGDSKLMIPISVYGGYLGYRGKRYFRSATRLDESEGFFYGGNIGIEFIPEEHIGLRLSFGPNFRDLEAYTGGFEENLVDWRMRFGCGYYLTRWKTPTDTEDLDTSP